MLLNREYGVFNKVALNKLYDYIDDTYIKNLKNYNALSENFRSQYTRLEKTIKNNIVKSF